MELSRAVKKEEISSSNVEQKLGMKKMFLGPPEDDWNSFSLARSLFLNTATIKGLILIFF